MLFKIRENFYHNTYFVVGFLLIMNVCALLYAISNLSISYQEAKIFYDGHSLVAFIVRESCKIFGQNDYALRSPFLFIHCLNVILLYRISKPILKRRFDRVVAISIYMALPGVLAGAILVNAAVILIFITLLSVYFEQRHMKKSLAVLLVCSLFISHSFITLYFAFFAYKVYKRDMVFAAFSLILFIISATIAGINSGGKPKGYFLDTIGVFAAVFSPLIFMYFVYSMYRIWIKNDKNLLWFICVTSFCFCMLWSLRQRLELEDFLPFCVIATPLMVRSFFNSYRARLPIFRTKYKFFTFIVLISLILNSTAIIFNGILYSFFKNPQKHFIYKYDVAKELAMYLKNRGIFSINANNEEILTRLKFYKISSGGSWFLSNANSENSDFVLRRGRVIVACFNITNKFNQKSLTKFRIKYAALDYFYMLKT